LQIRIRLTIEVPDDDAAVARRVDMGQFCTTVLAMTGYSRQSSFAGNVLQAMPRFDRQRGSAELPKVMFPPAPLAIFFDMRRGKQP